MASFNSRAQLQALIGSLALRSAADGCLPPAELAARLAGSSDMRPGELTRALAVELRLQELEKDHDVSGLTISHIRELRRIQPERAAAIDEVARKAITDFMSVRTLRALVDDSIRGQGVLATTAREAAFRDGVDFERSAFAFVGLNKALFTDERAILAPQPRGARIPVDFVLKDGTGLLVAFECKAAKRTPPARKVIELAAAHSLFSRSAREMFAVFPASDPAFPESFRACVEEHRLERLNTLTLDLGWQDSGRCTYRIHRRDDEGWRETVGEGAIARTERSVKD